MRLGECHRRTASRPKRSRSGWVASRKPTGPIIIWTMHEDSLARCPSYWVLGQDEVCRDIALHEFPRNVHRHRRWAPCHCGPRVCRRGRIIGRRIPAACERSKLFFTSLYFDVDGARVHPCDDTALPGRTRPPGGDASKYSAAFLGEQIESSAGGDYILINFLRNISDFPWVA
jgi:hypothetical protein